LTEPERLAHWPTIGLADLVVGSYTSTIRKKTSYTDAKYSNTQQRVVNEAIRNGKNRSEVD
jgi:hypothetical protein